MRGGANAHEAGEVKKEEEQASSPRSQLPLQFCCCLRLIFLRIDHTDLLFYIHNFIRRMHAADLSIDSESICMRNEKNLKKKNNEFKKGKKTEKK